MVILLSCLIYHRFIRAFNLMMFFSTGTGLERVGVAGLDLDCWWTEMQAFGLSGLR